MIESSTRSTRLDLSYFLHAFAADDLRPWQKFRETIDHESEMVVE